MGKQFESCAEMADPTTNDKDNYIVVSNLIRKGFDFMKSLRIMPSTIYIEVLLTWSNLTFLKGHSASLVLLLLIKKTVMLDYMYALFPGNPLHIGKQFELRAEMADLAANNENFILYGNTLLFFFSSNFSII